MSVTPLNGKLTSKSWAKWQCFDVGRCRQTEWVRVSVQYTVGKKWYIYGLISKADCEVPLAFNRSSFKDCKNQIIHCHAEIKSSPTSSSPLASSDPSDPFAEPNFLHSGLVMGHCQVHVHQCLNFDSLRLCSVPLPRPASKSEDSSLIIYRGRQWLWLRYPVCPDIGTPRFECPPWAGPKSR